MNTLNKSWPLTPAGAADWDVVFEDRETGFIPLIARAHTPEALEKCTKVVIRKLFTRKNDRSEVKKFTVELATIIDGDAPVPELDAMRYGVTGLLRRIKEERKRKANAHVARMKAGETRERRAAIVERKPVIKSTRFFSSLEGWLGGVTVFDRFPWVWRSVLGGLIVGGVAFLANASIWREEMPTYSHLVEQMVLTADHGAVPASHVFGGALRVESMGGNIAITAQAVPRKPCVNAAWVLARTGRVAINGVMPSRITAAVLGELCGRGSRGGKITWIPR